MLATAAIASATPLITSATFSGGSAAPGPTITLTGSGFGATAPKGTPDGACGPSTGNGDLYGTSFWFYDDTNTWQAGYSTKANTNCMGLVINSWSPTKVVFSFGNAYGAVNWFANAGDNYVIAVKGFYWGGVVSYSSGPARDTRTHHHIRTRHRTRS